MAERLAQAAVQADGGLESMLTLGYAQGFGNRPIPAEETLSVALDLARTDME